MFMGFIISRAPIPFQKMPVWALRLFPKLLANFDIMANTMVMRSDT